MYVSFFFLFESLFNSILQMAEIYVTEIFGPFYQVKGTNSIYNPRVLKKNVNQESITHIWVQNGGTNKVAFGWHVSFN